MIELFDAAVAGVVGGLLCGAVEAIRSSRRKRKRAQDERAELIAAGESYGIPFVPGENLDDYRRRVVKRRDDRALEEERVRLVKGGRP